MFIRTSLLWLLIFVVSTQGIPTPKNFFPTQITTKELSIAPYTPYFTTPNPSYRHFELFLRICKKLKVQQQGIFISHSQFDGSYTPIVRNITIYQVVLDDKKLWVCPELKIKEVKDRNDIFFVYQNSHYLLLAVILILLGILAIYGHFYFKIEGISFYLMASLLFYWGCACLFIYVHGPFYIGWIDGHNYVNIAHNLSHFEKPAGYQHPVGWSIMILPLYWLKPTTNIFELGPWISWSNLFVYNALVVICLFMLAWEITRKKNNGLCVSFIYILLPWFYVTYRIGFPSSVWGFSVAERFWAFTSFELLVPSSSFDLHLYRAAIWQGASVLSETPSLAIFLLGILLLGKQNGFLAFLAGVLLGFSGAIRVVYVIFVPCALLWRFSRDIQRSDWLKKYSCVLLGGILGFLPQVIENIWISGSPFVFPYQVYFPKEVRHEWSLFLPGLRYLTSLHYQLLFLIPIALWWYNPKNFRIFVNSFFLVTFGFFAGFASNFAEEVRYLSPCLVFFLLYLVCYSSFLLEKMTFNIRTAFFIITIALHLFGFVPHSPQHSTFLLKILFYPIVVQLGLLFLAFICGYLYQGRKGALYAGFLSGIFLLGFWFIPCVAIIFISVATMISDMRLLQKV